MVSMGEIMALDCGKSRLNAVREIRCRWNIWENIHIYTIYIYIYIYIYIHSPEVWYIPSGTFCIYCGMNNDVR